MTTQKVILICVFFISLSGCSVDQRIANRSGTIEDDYIGEPVSERSKSFENALTTSNEILTLIESGDYNAIFDHYFQQTKASGLVTQTEFKITFEDLIDRYGKILEYKRDQWGFVENSPSDGNHYLYSVKIVIHEKEALDYYFVFEYDSTFDKIVGFYTKPREGTREPGSI